MSFWNNFLHRRSGAEFGDSLWKPIGTIQDISSTESGVSLKCDAGLVVFTSYADNVCRIRVTRDSENITISQPDQLSSFDTVIGDLAIEVRTGNWIVRIGRQPFRMGIEDADGRLFYLDYAGIQWNDNNSWRLSLSRLAHENSYGFGCWKSGLKLTEGEESNEVTRLSSSDSVSLSYALYLAIHSSGIYGVCFPQSSISHLEFSGDTNKETSFYVEKQPILDYFVITGQSVAEILSSYADVAGHQLMPAIKRLGYQHITHFKTHDDVLKLIHTFRERAIPCDVVSILFDDSLSITSEASRYDVQILNDYPGTTQDGVSHNRPVEAATIRSDVEWVNLSEDGWDGLKRLIGGVLNLGLSGIPFVGVEISNQSGENGSGDYYVRLMQIACLMPFIRSRSLPDCVTEPWRFGQPYELINRLTLDLRYRLIPYLYSAIALSTQYGWPVLRPLFFAEPDNMLLRTIEDCFMVGDALLVAPVLQADAMRRDVYLPKGEWYDFWTNEHYRGGEMITVTAPLDRLPIFVRAGSVIPMWQDQQYISLKKRHANQIYRVYCGDAETTLYEDGGEGDAYRDGHYRWIYLNTHLEGQKLIINRRAAGQFEAYYDEIMLEVLGLQDEPQSILVDRRNAPIWFFDEGRLEITVKHFQQIEIVPKIAPDEQTIARRMQL